MECVSTNQKPTAYGRGPIKALPFRRESGTTNNRVGVDASRDLVRRAQLVTPNALWKSDRARLGLARAPRTVTAKTMGVLEFGQSSATVAPAGLSQRLAPLWGAIQSHAPWAWLITPQNTGGSMCRERKLEQFVTPELRNLQKSSGGTNCSRLRARPGRRRVRSSRGMPSEPDLQDYQAPPRRIRCRGGRIETVRRVVNGQLLLPLI